MSRVSYVGQRVKRLEDPRLVTGRGSFVDDIKLPGTLYAKVLRSPFAHARILSIDAAAAKGEPGVVEVLTSEDLPGHARHIPNAATVQNSQGQDAGAPRHPALAIGEVRYVGQPVALVIADGRYAAQDAVEMVEVDYEPLDPVVDPFDAAADRSPPIHRDSEPTRP